VKDKLIGVAFILIATILYLANTVLTVWYAINVERVISRLGRMGTAVNTIGSAPKVWALIALGLGTFYIGRAEFREYKHRKDKS
jgi:hypothetical protein